MPQADINYLAVLVAGLSSMVVGAIWYAKPLFGNAWMRLEGMTEEKAKQKMGVSYSGMFILALVLAYVLAHFVDYTNATTIGAGMTTGFWLWLGFVFTTKGASYLFGQKSMKLFFIDVGYHLVEILVMGAILASWT
ncbi:MAG: DUF1761 domain-containing protein [Candidatus Kerfeldbacteria bacterium]|nr:DUF1761 domain-containing protein [Candidatus Kerfeldbacteria bacterium]